MKVSIPKGMRDFSPEVMAKRNYIFDTIKKSFQTYGFEQIETPTMENRETLTGKYGEEGDRLIFNVINSGDYLKKVRDIDELGYDDFTFFVLHIRSLLWGVVSSRYSLQDILNESYINTMYVAYVKRDLTRKYIEDNFDFLLEKIDESLAEYENNLQTTKTEQSIDENFKFNQSIRGQIIPSILSFARDQESFSFSRINLSNTIGDLSDKALRYDLTVPFARYVVQRQNEITFPFKRYQIQPVWRADRPQKGRYREFYQCDADIIGSDSLLNEVELVKLFDEVLTNLGMKDFSIKLNNRKILSGIAEVIGRPEMIIPITVAIDKLDKIGLEKVNEELTQRGLTTEELKKIQPLFKIEGTNSDKLAQLSSFLKASEIGLKGIEETQFILDTVANLGLRKAKLEVDVTLARGLDYYTGAIFEVATNEAKMGSICGGGRYADLTGIFGLKDMSGVGISFGADRIYDVMEELNLFPESANTATQVLFINFGEKESSFALPLVYKLREAGVRTELYPDAAKMKKQMKFANDKHIPIVVMIGEEEMTSGKLSVKNMQSGEQSKLTVAELITSFNL